MFRKNKKPPQETTSNNESVGSDGDDDSVFKDSMDNFNHTSVNDEDLKKKDFDMKGKTTPENAIKSQMALKLEKTMKPEKHPKSVKFLKQQQLESMKRKISVPFLDDNFPEVLNPGLEGRPLCRLLKVNEDETRVVEMIRPHTGPLGVFFTKGQEQNDEGKRKTCKYLTVWSLYLVMRTSSM